MAFLFFWLPICAPAARGQPPTPLLSQNRTWHMKLRRMGGGRKAQGKGFRGGESVCNGKRRRRARGTLPPGRKWLARLTAPAPPSPPLSLRHSLVDDAVEGGALEVEGLAGHAGALLAWR